MEYFFTNSHASTACQIIGDNSLTAALKSDGAMSGCSSGEIGGNGRLRADDERRR
jgi:hypothetical protein